MGVLPAWLPREVSQFGDKHRYGNPEISTAKDTFNIPPHPRIGMSDVAEVRILIGALIGLLFAIAAQKSPAHEGGGIQISVKRPSRMAGATL